MERVFPFLKYRYIAIGLTNSIIVVFFIITFATGGFKPGIDFVGGLKLTVKFENTIHEDKIRKALQSYDPMVQQFGHPEKNEFIISVKLPSKDDEAKKTIDTLKDTLTKTFKGATIASTEHVGPAIGDYITKNALKLVIVSILLMTVYLAFRFELKYSVGAMIALIHDLLITIGLIGVLGIEINIPIVAALLTIFGYSVNDTIIIFDRIRENMQHREKQTFIHVIDHSITQTLSRTILTVLTVQLSVLSIFFLGGDTLHDFSKVLLLGFTVGAYSSIYIASPFVVWWEKLTHKKG